MMVKTPHGTWLVMLAAIFGVVWLPKLRGRLRDDLFLLGVMLLLFSFVSLQTGINRHSRYVLSAFPFAFILASRVGRLFNRSNWIQAVPAIAGCVWLLISSLATYPHHLGYFNELAGGPKNGVQHLSSSNIDWGQDLLYLADWLEDHPEVELDGLAWHCRVVDPSIVGLKAGGVPEEPEAGWYAVSMNKMPPCSKTYRYFENIEPVAWAGYSIPIFHITEEDAVRLREILASTSLETDNEVTPNDEYSEGEDFRLYAAGGLRAGEPEHEVVQRSPALLPTLATQGR
jgi:hypothetical protein